MLGIARMMDITYGVCSNHDDPQNEYGYIITSQVKVLVNGLPAAVMFDMAITDAGCGTGTIIGGSGKVFCSGLPMAQQFSQFTGVYTGYILGCSGNVMCA